MSQAILNQPITTSIESLRNRTQIQPTTDIQSGFSTQGGFDLIQRVAKMFSSSTLVPRDYCTFPRKGEQNPSAIANCIIALGMAQRLDADPLMVMQNLYIVEGKPSWSSQYIIASINSCGRYSSLHFDIEELEEKTVEVEITEWKMNPIEKKKEKYTSTKKETILDKRCIAWAIEKSTNLRIESPPITIEMAVKEGWFSKKGSKWKTMPEIMLRYRAASFFGKLYAPELLMGIKSTEELEDSIIEVEKDDSGHFSMSLDDIKSTVQKKTESIAENNADISTEQANGPTTEKKTKKEPEKKVDTKAQESKESLLAQPTVAMTSNISTSNNTVKGKKESYTSQYLLQSKNTYIDSNTFECPHSGRLIDDIDCVDCKHREGCPQLEN